MELILIWLLVNVFTRLGQKLKLSWTVLAVVLSLIFWGLYYIAINYYPTEWKEILITLSGIYATSQIVFNLIKKLGIIK